ncbi:DUF1616 domain-containing protein [Chloroflexota bacterium]
MKIRLPSVILIIDILVIILILSITFVQSNIIRIILGLPFLLYFPGYLLMAVLFPRKEGIDNPERVALSLGMSIAIVPLIGLALNYTTWGIRLEPVLYSISFFILIMSFVALLRQHRLFKKVEFLAEHELRLPGWESTTTNKILSIMLALSILGTIGILGYTVANPKVGEKFTEYYILGNSGKAQDYPSKFTMESGQVTRLQYGTEMPEIISERGMVTIGIVNREYRLTSYLVTMAIDGEPVAIFDGVKNISRLGPIELVDGEKWEQEIGFTPQHIGDNQKVEFFLIKNGGSDPYLTLHFWIDVK